MIRYLVQLDNDTSRWQLHRSTRDTCATFKMFLFQKLGQVLANCTEFWWQIKTDFMIEDDYRRRPHSTRWVPVEYPNDPVASRSVHPYGFGRLGQVSFVISVGFRFGSLGTVTTSSVYRLAIHLDIYSVDYFSLIILFFSVGRQFLLGKNLPPWNVPRSPSRQSPRVVKERKGMTNDRHLAQDKRKGKTILETIIRNKYYYIINHCSGTNLL